METGSSFQQKNTIKSSSICAVQDEGHNDGECPRVDVHSTQSCMDQQTQGKQKKTPFKFFGGKKSIVTLPSFFGGKHKGLGKGNARKSMSKSKTHDCISDVPGDDGKKGCSDNSINRHHGHDLYKTGNTLPSSLSADSGITSPVKLDFSFHDISPMGSTECFEKKVNGEKSFSFPRPKKGLKGLFSSIRRHKRNKTPDPDKCERYDHITETVILEQLNKYPSEDAELQCSSEQPKIKSQETEIPTDCLVNLTIVSENEETQQGSVTTPNSTPHKSKECVVDTNEGLINDQNAATNSKTDSIADGLAPDVSPEVQNTDLDRESSPNSTGDHLSLMFEDVSSLKSFDSLTGCGDIIAEQDIDNISDTSLSLERSRETTKRSSCLVTYQGGGEEMATPDDMEEEYLQRLLEDGNEVDASYELEEKVHEDMSKSFTELQPHAYSMGAEDAFVDRTILSSAELLTPQSDQQESAPNSDEGYYDSTTPGPDDDGGEGFSHKERLPRDSYSGDALYEFYEPDDSLMSPAPGGESLYESKTLCSEIFDHFFDFNLPINSGLSQDAECKKGATETEEERLAVIQKQLLFWEMQREAALKGLGHVNKDSVSKEKQIECDIRAVDLLGRGKACLTREHNLLQSVSKDVGDKGIKHTENRKQTWKEYQETPLPDSDYHRGFIHVEGNGLVENPGFELNVDSFKAHDQTDTKPAAIPKLSNSIITPMHRVQNVFGSEFTCLSNYNAGDECEQAVDFAENGMLFSSISERLGSAGSSSSFHHNLNALPTMITFDVVDFENEGECEQQVDLSPDEEVVSSYETFDHSYVQESLAECDEHLLQMDSHQSFNNYTWGVTSLPRHLEQYKLSPFKPAPLSVNRRSKSLDTESLELELGGVHISKSGLKSYDLLTPWEDRKNSYQYDHRFAHGDKAKFNSCKMLGQIALTNEEHKAYTPVLSSKQGYSREMLGSNTSSQLPLDSRELGKTTTETVQPQEDSTSCRYSRDNTTKKLARVLPLEEQRSVDTQFSCDYDGPHKQMKAKPVGITQAMPQQHKKDYDLQFDFVEMSGPSKKGILEHRDTSPIDWSNNYECSHS